MGFRERISGDQTGPFLVDVHFGCRTGSGSAEEGRVLASTLTTCRIHPW